MKRCESRSLASDARDSLTFAGVRTYAVHPRRCHDAIHAEADGDLHYIAAALTNCNAGIDKNRQRKYSEAQRLPNSICVQWVQCNAIFAMQCNAMQPTSRSEARSPLTCAAPVAIRNGPPANSSIPGFLRSIVRLSLEAEIHRQAGHGDGLFVTCCNTININLPSQPCERHENKRAAFILARRRSLPWIPARVEPTAQSGGCGRILQWLVHCGKAFNRMLGGRAGRPVLRPSESRSTSSPRYTLGGHGRDVFLVLSVVRDGTWLWMERAVIFRLCIYLFIYLFIYWLW